MNAAASDVRVSRAAVVFTRTHCPATLLSVALQLAYLGHVEGLLSCRVPLITRFGTANAS